MTTDQHTVEAPQERVALRWAVLEHAQAREQANIAAALVDFSDVPPAVALDLYYKVADRAAAPASQPGAFPRGDLRGLDKFLRGELRFQLLHYKRDRRRAIPDPEDILANTTGRADPAREVEQRQALRDIARIVNDELAEADLTPAARAYFVADQIEGLKRAEIQRHLGWSEHRIKQSRKELREHDAESLWRAMVARIHDALTNVLPVPVLRLLGRGPGGPSASEVAAGAAGGTLLGGAGIKVAAACLAAAACAVPALVALDRPHRAPLSSAARTDTGRGDRVRDAISDRPTRATVSLPVSVTSSSARLQHAQRPRSRSAIAAQTRRDTRQAEQAQPAAAPAGSNQTSELMPTGGAGSSASASPAPAPSSGGGEFLP